MVHGIFFIVSIFTTQLTSPYYLLVSSVKLAQCLDQQYFIFHSGLEVHKSVCYDKFQVHTRTPWQGSEQSLSHDWYWRRELGNTGNQFAKIIVLHFVTLYCNYLLNASPVKQHYTVCKAYPIRLELKLNIVQALAMYSWSSEDFGLLSVWCPTPANHSGKCRYNLSG